LSRNFLAQRRKANYNGGQPELACPSRVLGIGGRRPSTFNRRGRKEDTRYFYTIDKDLNKAQKRKGIQELSEEEVKNAGKNTSKYLNFLISGKGFPELQEWYETANNMRNKGFYVEQMKENKSTWHTPNDVEKEVYEKSFKIVKDLLEKLDLGQYGKIK
jgi:hypothetical protein